MIIAIAIEGTLAQGPDLHTAAAYRGARPLYEALRDGYQLVAFTRASLDVAQWWLRKEYMAKWSKIHSFAEETFFESEPDWKMHEVRSYLAAGWEVGFVIDTDERVLPKMHELGVSTMRITHAQTMPGFRDLETAAPRPWAEVATVERPIEGANNGSG